MPACIGGMSTYLAKLRARFTSSQCTRRMLDTVFAAATLGQLYRSTDGGKSWVSLPQRLSGNFARYCGCQISLRRSYQLRAPAAKSASISITGAAINSCSCR